MCSPDAVFMSSNKSQFTPRNFSTPPGGYSYMNPGYVDHVPRLPHLPSPMDLIQLGNQPSCSKMGQNDIRTQNSFGFAKDRKVSETSPTRFFQKLPFVSKSVSSSNSSTSVATPVEVKKTSTDNHFFGPDFSLSSTTSVESSVKVCPSDHANTQQVSKSRMQSRSLKQKPVSKPPLPRRSSSLKAHKTAANTTKSCSISESNKTVTKVTSKPPIPLVENHYQTPRSPPTRMIDDQQDSANLNRTVVSSNYSETTGFKLMQTSKSSPQIPNSCVSTAQTPVISKGAVTEARSSPPANSSSTSRTASHISTPMPHAEPHLATKFNTEQKPVLLDNLKLTSNSLNIERNQLTSNSTSTSEHKKDVVLNRRLSEPENSNVKANCKLNDRPPTPKRHLTSNVNFSKPTRLFDPTTVNIIVSEKTYSTADPKCVSQTDSLNVISLSSDTRTSSVLSSSDGRSTSKVSSHIKQGFSSSVSSSKECNSTPKVEPYSITSLISDSVISPGATVAEVSSSASKSISSVVATTSLTTSSNSTTSLNSEIITSPLVTSPKLHKSFNCTLSEQTTTVMPPKSTLVVMSTGANTQPVMTPSVVTSPKPHISFNCTLSEQTAAVMPPKSTLTVMSTGANTSPVITSSVVTSPKPQAKKPVIRPKPFSISRQRSESDKKGQKSDDIKRRTASARAAFFGLPNTLSSNESNPSDNKFLLHEKALDKTKVDTPLFSIRAADPKTIEEVSDSNDIQSKSSKSVETSSDRIQVYETDIDEVEPRTKDAETPTIFTTVGVASSKNPEPQFTSSTNARGEEPQPIVVETPITCATEAASSKHPESQLASSSNARGDEIQTHKLTMDHPNKKATKQDGKTVVVTAASSNNNSNISMRIDQPITINPDRDFSFKLVFASI